MALKLNGKGDRLRRADFRALAGTAGLKAGEAEAAIDDMIGRMSEAVDRLTFPELPNYGPEGAFLAARMFDIIRSRLTSFA